MQSGTMVAGRYRLDERLAAGGMGEVWKGFDTRLSRSVAIKILHAGLSTNDKFRARFQLEARAVAALQSPGIVALYDYGEEDGDDGTIAYLVMELVRGRSLAEILQERGPLPPAEVMQIVATAADALEVAHRADIIHRDIKPANLLVDEAAGAVKIVDFGIAAARGASGLTETGTVMGTLAYASPEQLNGGELSGATDLYSLGCVAYEALMGRPPFVSETPVAVMNGHMNQAPPPLKRDIPAGVAQVVLQALQKEPQARYGSAADMGRSAREGRVVTGGIPLASSPPQSATRMFGAAGAGTAAGQRTGNMTAAQPTGQMGEAEGGGGKAVPWLITGAVTVVVALILMLLYGPLQNGRGGEFSENDSNTMTPAEDAETKTPGEVETTEDDTDDWDDDNWEAPTSEEPTTEEPTETASETETTDPDEPTTSEPAETTSEPEPEPTDTQSSPEPTDDGTEDGGDGNGGDEPN
ncbi:hypothetical protein GCM10027447_27050 [Glycomyces halotolerans]